MLIRFLIAVIILLALFGITMTVWTIRYHKDYLLQKALFKDSVWKITSLSDQVIQLESKKTLENVVKTKSINKDKLLSSFKVFARTNYSEDRRKRCLVMVKKFIETL